MEISGQQIGAHPLYIKSEGNTIYSISDTDHDCMKVAVASFEILILTQVAPRSNGPIGRSRVVLHLQPKFDFEKLDMRYEANDREADVIGLTAASVLKFLHEADCVGKDALTFQYRRGSTESADYTCSNICSIGLKKNSQSRGEQLLRAGEGIISHAYAYIEERELCLFLNTTESEILQKIEAVLVQHFPKKT